MNGKGVVVGVIDTGIDYLNSAFIDNNGHTRILELWDQTRGEIYGKEKINNAIEAYRQGEDPYKIVPSRDISGHGTHVAGICCGNFAANKEENAGLATESDMLVVKLGNRSDTGFPRTTELMEAINYCVTYCADKNLPLCINISFGNNYGSHDGNSLLETFIDTATDVGKTTIVVGSGNEGAMAGHASGRLYEKAVVEELQIGRGEGAMDIQLWKNFVDNIDIELVGPSGESLYIPVENEDIKNVGNIKNIENINNTEPFGEIKEKSSTFEKRKIYRKIFTDTQVLVYVGEPSVYNIKQEIYISLAPLNDYIEAGMWKLILNPGNIVDGRYQLWLPVKGALRSETFFLRSDPNNTLTIPSTARKVITVGAYNEETGAYETFSGRGPENVECGVKPDVAAPGVNILSSSPGGELTRRTGTSMATPIITGICALAMEWGIVMGNDKYLYGERLRAYIQKMAKRDDSVVWPNNKLGWGKYL